MIPPTWWGSTIDATECNSVVHLSVGEAVSCFSDHIALLVPALHKAWMHLHATLVENSISIVGALADKAPEDDVRQAVQMACEVEDKLIEIYNARRQFLVAYRLILGEYKKAYEQAQRSGLPGSSNTTAATRRFEEKVCFSPFARAHGHAMLGSAWRWCSAEQ